MILYRAIPQRDIKPLAKELIARSARSPRWSPRRATPRRAQGPGRRRHHRAESRAGRREPLARGEVSKRPVLSSWSSVLDYCRAAMASPRRSSSASCFSTSATHLIADEVQQEGTVDHTPVYPREVVKRALELSATAIILVHNHPSGDPTPSRADIEMTRRSSTSPGHSGSGARSHHCRQGRARELEGVEADSSAPRLVAIRHQHLPNE